MRSGRIGRGRRPSPVSQSEDFFNPIISKLDKHVVLLPINYIASKNRWTWQIFDSRSLIPLRSARHRSNTLTQYFVLLSVFLFWLSSLIPSKSVASISGNLAEDSIWNSAIINTKQTLRAMIASWRLKAVIIAVIWLADIRFINLSWHLIGWWKVSRFSSNWTVCSKLKETFQKKLSYLF